MDGNLTIRALVDGSADKNCQKSLALGRTQIASLAWIVQRLNYLNYLNGITIGLEIFDTCSNTERRVNTLLELYLNDTKKCSDHNSNIPILTTNEIAFEIQQFSNLFNIPIIQITESFNHELLVDATIQFLITMNFNKDIVLVTNSDVIENLFNHLAKEQWLCIRNSYKISELQQVKINKSDILVIFGNKEQISILLSKTLNKYLKAQLILVPLDESTEYEVIPPNNSYIILPSYADYYQTMIEYLKLTTSPILLNVAKPILKITMNIRSLIETQCQNLNDSTLLQNCVEKYYDKSNENDTNLTDYEVLQILKIEQLYNKFFYEIHEIINMQHQNFVESTPHSNSHSNIFVSDLIITHKISTYNMFNRTLFYENGNIKNNTTKQLCKLPHLECLIYCKNFNKYRENYLPKNGQIEYVIKWRSEAWVAALVSISTIGFFSTFAVLMFILVRLLKGDILEGNPTGSIFLLIIIILMYSTVIPFTFILETQNISEVEFDYILQNTEKTTEGNNTFVTDQNINENSTEIFINEIEDTTFSYENVSEINNNITSLMPDLIEYVNYTNLIYSSYLASTQLRPNDSLIDDLKEHVPDNYETVMIEYQNLICTYTVFAISLLYTFAFSILLSRFIVVATIGHDGGFMSHVNGYIQATLCFFMTLVQVAFNSELWMLYHNCDTIFNGNFILILISYDIFLLILLACVSPFVIRSQRNYKEGVMVSIAVYIVCVIWALWIAMYYLTGREWRNIILVSGVISTATVLLVGVFIPRTYLMMTGIARDRITNALPTLAHTQSTSILDINFRTNSQAIYGCVNPIPISSILHNSGELPPPLPVREGNYYSEAPEEGYITEHSHQNFTEENTYERYDTPPSPTKITRF